MVQLPFSHPHEGSVELHVLPGPLPQPQHPDGPPHGSQEPVLTFPQQLYAWIWGVIENTPIEMITTTAMSHTRIHIAVFDIIPTNLTHEKMLWIFIASEMQCSEVIS